MTSAGLEPVFWAPTLHVKPQWCRTVGVGKDGNQIWCQYVIDSERTDTFDGVE
ncbi:MAG: hypothetical protein ACRDQZ_15565 [Mycobacteriales bacterium]